MKSLESKNLDTSLFGFKQLFRKFDVSHIHYSNLFKRLLGVAIGKLLAEKVIFTVHGKYLDVNNIWNKLSIYLSDGIIVLNVQIYNTLLKAGLSKRIIILPSLFQEGFGSNSDKLISIDSDNTKKYLLLYAYDKNYSNGEEIYGVDFVLQNLEQLPEEYCLVLLDLSGKYQASIPKRYQKRVIYVNESVDFISLLKQVDAYIRPTCMDGASVAVQEALMLGVPVIASDVVDRPEEVVIFEYKNFSDFLLKLEMSFCHNLVPPKNHLNSVDEYTQFCNEL